MSEAKRCPGNELNKSLGTIDIKCSSCGTVNEIFSDEADKAHKCTKCGTPLDTAK
jgi:ribosomal protein S27E